MAVTIIGGIRPERGAGLRVKQSLTQSAATAFQAVNLFVDLAVLGMGTVTGFGVNQYALASGAVEGQEISILTTGTGEAKLFIAGTATGQHVFTEPDDYLRTIYEDGKWRILVSSATLATST